MKPYSSNSSYSSIPGQKPGYALVAVVVVVVMVVCGAP
jgi:hypothetical protein